MAVVSRVRIGRSRGLMDYWEIVGRGEMGFVGPLGCRVAKVNWNASEDSARDGGSGAAIDRTNSRERVGDDGYNVEGGRAPCGWVGAVGMATAAVKLGEGIWV